MTALDTSVLIPALVEWHVAHQLCHDAAHEATVPAHALLEAYAVLTRLPAPHRIATSDAARLLDARFGATDVLVPPPELHRRLPALLAGSEIGGGASYDALVGLTAQLHGHQLMTRDRRAARTYARLGVDVAIIDGGDGVRGAAAEQHH